MKLLIMNLYGKSSGRDISRIVNIRIIRCEEAEERKILYTPASFF